MKGFTRFEGKLKRIAGYITRDKHLQKDLCQEMLIYLWQIEEGNTDSYYLQGAKFCALQYLRKHIGKEIYIGTLNDLEKYICQETRTDPNFYDSWHDVDKAIEKFTAGNSV